MTDVNNFGHDCRYQRRFAPTIIHIVGMVHSHRRNTQYGVQVLDQLLFVLVLVEILHTVRISIRAHEILIEPFLIVGLIASIRRVLVITM